MTSSHTPRCVQCWVRGSVPGSGGRVRDRVLDVYQIVSVGESIRRGTRSVSVNRGKSGLPGTLVAPILVSETQVSGRDGEGRTGEARTQGGGTLPTLFTPTPLRLTEFVPCVHSSRTIASRYQDWTVWYVLSLR